MECFNLSGYLLGYGDCWNHFVLLELVFRKQFWGLKHHVLYFTLDCVELVQHWKLLLHLSETVSAVADGHGHAERYFIATTHSGRHVVLVNFYVLG